MFGVLVGLVVMVVSGCGGDDTTDVGVTSKLRVITTTALLADMARNVGGELVEVRSIVPAGADVHSFQSSPGDSIAISEARVIISNGGGLDDFMQPLLAGAKQADAVQVTASDMIPPALAQSPVDDPHYWQSPPAATMYVDQILIGLAGADPANADVYRSGASEYIDDIIAMDQEVSELLKEVPEERRHLITFHDSFGHFASHYGWEVSALVPNDAGEVTPRAVSDVIELIEDKGIPAIFAEPQFSSQFLEEIARESGARVATIYSDTIDDEVSTYIDMMRFNARSMAENLR